MGFTHLQKAVRDRTIDALPNEPGAITDPIIALNYLIEGLEARLTRLEGLVTQLSRDALRNAVDAATVTRNASPITRDAESDAVDAQTVTRDARERYTRAQRQRRYRERKKLQAT